MSGSPGTAIWLVIAAFVLTVPLVSFARRVGVSYPIVLVLAGLVLGFAPGLPPVQLDPDLVLVIFLPPLLFWESITAPTDVMRANAGWITSLAIGLVIATTGVVAVVAHAAIPGLAWPMAFVLGAIVAPTDELASAPVLERLRMPRHLVAVVEGESLLNDASSLILYATAVAAVVTGAFNPGIAVLQFFGSAIGGVLVGVACAWLAIATWRRVRDIDLQPLVAFTLPFLTYALATRFAVSGVLAVVAAGIVASRFTPFGLVPRARMRGADFYEASVFLANAILFLLLGLQLRIVGATVLREYAWWTVLAYAAAINVTIITLRFGWFVLLEYVPWFGGEGKYSEPSVRRALVASWSGLRGAVSLAAALAIPVAVAGGAGVPNRDLVIFLTFSVILVTLVGGGLTLPSVVRALKIPPGDDEEAEELRTALTAMSRSAHDRLHALEREGLITAADTAVLARHYASRRRLPGAPVDREEQRRFAAEREVLLAERTALVKLRNAGGMDNTVLRRIVHSLDIAEEAIPAEDSPPLPE
ncbi:MAG: nha [Candidatus Eremiobacteraeota bacterium]|nr:nha [Candidatus Eremiobacteraeota bacterium]